MCSFGTATTRCSSSICGACRPRALRQQPAGAWHRLRLAAEQNTGAILVQSAAGFVPAVPWRLALQAAAGLGELRRPRGPGGGLAVEVERGHAEAREELAG